MAEQKSRLVLEIDSRDAEQKAIDLRRGLEGLEEAGARTKPAMDKASAGIDGAGKAAGKARGNLDQLGQAADKAGASTGRTAETAEQASARLLAMAKSSLQASEYVNSLAGSTTAASSAFDAASDKASSLAALSSRLRAESDALAGSTDKGAAATKRASVATDIQASELTELLGKINPAVAALGRLDEQQSRLQKYKAAGLIDADTFRDYSTRLDASRQKLGDFDEGLRKTGISAGQTTTALRQLPTQFTDIFTSLAAGQSPLLVLLQQGGQIKDSFGGISNTADVLGGKVKALFSSITGSVGSIFGVGAAVGELALQQAAVANGSEAAADGLGGLAEGANTASDSAENAKKALDALNASTSGASITMLGAVGIFTAVAASVALLIYGYSKGSKEADAYNNALILTGNYAGTSSSQLSTMASRIGDATTTVSAASAALVQLSASAKISVDSFEMIATSALNMEDATGKAVSETIAEFVKIADSPTKAIADLNEKFGFLTAAQYENIRSLEKLGDKQGAATIAGGLYAAAMDERSAQIKANLGTIERAWDDVAGAAKRGWDALLGVGRQQGLDEQIENTQKLLDGRNTGFLAKMFPDDLGAGSDSSKFLEQKLKILIKQRDTLAEQGKVEGENARVQREGLEAYEKYKKGVEDNFSKTQKMNKALKDEQDAINKSRLAGYTITAEQEAAALKAIRENSIFKETKSKAYTEDAGMKALDQARQQYAVLQQQNALIGVQKGEVDKLGASGQALVKWEQELADIKGKQTLTADQKSLLANQELITAQLKRNAGLERENELRKTAAEEISKLAAFQANQNSRLATAQEGLDSKIAGIGLGDQARDRLKQDLDIQKDYARQSAALLEQRNTGKISPDLYTKENAILSEGLAARLVKQQDYYNQEDAARGNWVAGASSSWQNYLDIATDYGQQARDATANLLGDTTSSLSSQIQGLIDGTVTLGEAFRSLGTTMATSVLGALSDIAAQWVVTHALKMAGITAETGLVVASEGTKTAAKVTGDAIATGSSLASIATTVAANVTAAATTMASWLPAALVASIGTFGAAAVVGGAGLLAAFALIKGFSSGGYTGAGGVNEPAGMVHKGEVVWSQADIRRSGGVASVEALRKGNVSPMNATGQSSSGFGAGAAAAPGNSNGGTVVNLHEDASKAGRVESRSEGGRDVVDIWVANIMSDGAAHQAMEQKYGLGTVGS